MGSSVKAGVAVNNIRHRTRQCFPASCSSYLLFDQQDSFPTRSVSDTLSFGWRSTLSLWEDTDAIYKQKQMIMVMVSYEADVSVSFIWHIQTTTSRCIACLDVTLAVSWDPTYLGNVLYGRFYARTIFHARVNLSQVTINPKPLTSGRLGGIPSQCRRREKSTPQSPTILPHLTPEYWAYITEILAKVEASERRFGESRYRRQEAIAHFKIQSWTVDKIKRSWSKG